MRSPSDSGSRLTIALPLPCDARFGQPPDLELVGHAGGGEEQQRRMGGGDEDVGDEILVARRHAGAALAAAALHAIFGQRRALDIAGMGDGDRHVLALDQRFVLDLDIGVDQFGLARRGEFGRASRSVRRAMICSTRGARAQDVEIVLDRLAELGRPRRRFRRAPARSGAAGADRGWPWPVPRSGGWCRLPAIMWRGSAISATSGADVLGGPGARHQLLARRGGIGRGADQRDHLVDIGDGDGKADQDMAAVARLGELELACAG